MIYTPLKKILSNIKEFDRPYWRMFQKDEKNVIAECIDIEGITPSRSADMLDSEFKELQGTGYVIIKVYGRPPKQGGDNRNNLVYCVKVEGDDDQIGTIKNNNPSAGGNYSIISGLQQEITGLKMQLLQDSNKRDIEDLKRDFKDSQSKMDPLMVEMLGLAKSYIRPGIKQTVPAQQPVQPINGIDTRKEFANAIKQWAKADPNYLEAIKAIAYFAEGSQEMYKEQIQILIDAYRSGTNF